MCVYSCRVVVTMVLPVDVLIGRAFVDVTSDKFTRNDSTSLRCTVAHAMLDYLLYKVHATKLILSSVAITVLSLLFIISIPVQLRHLFSANHQSAFIRVEYDDAVDWSTIQSD